MAKPGTKDKCFCYHCEKIVIGTWQEGVLAPGGPSVGVGILCPLCGNTSGVFGLDKFQNHVIKRVEALEKVIEEKR